MRKTFFWVVICITLPILICALYFAYSAFFDDRMFLKDETKRVTSILKDTRIGEEFDLSQDCIKCDSIYLVEPYDAHFFERNNHLKLWPNIKRRISSITWDDSRNQLLFVKQNRVVGYADICEEITFYGSDREFKFPVNAKLYLDKNRNVRLQ